jgi:hypothetical protein
VSDIGHLDGVISAFVGFASGALALLWAIVVLVIVRGRDIGAEQRKSMFGAKVFACGALVFYPMAKVEPVAPMFDVLAMIAVFVLPIIAVGGTIYAHRPGAT